MNQKKRNHALNMENLQLPKNNRIYAYCILHLVPNQTYSMATAHARFLLSKDSDFGTVQGQNFTSMRKRKVSQKYEQKHIRESFATASSSENLYAVLLKLNIITVYVQFFCKLVEISTEEERGSVIKKFYRTQRNLLYQY